MHKFAHYTKPADIAPTRAERAADYLLAGVIGVLLALCLVAWWAS